MLLAMYEADPWQAQHPNVMVVLADEPASGTDWRDQEGWGWIFKAWFRTRAESRQAWEGFGPSDCNAADPRDSSAGRGSGRCRHYLCCWCGGRSPTEGSRCNERDLHSGVTACREDCDMVPPHTP